MKSPVFVPSLWLAVAALGLGACTRSTEASAAGAVATPVPAVAPAAGAATAAAQAGRAGQAAEAALPTVLVHKSPSCGCCGVWVEHLRQAGFNVDVRDVDDMGPVKQRLGVPHGKGSCHTAEVGGYLVEGHVPAEDVKRLLAQRPAARGLVLPGMPMGSPGMEMPDGRVQPYTVELVAQDGSTTPFAHHGGAGG